jgi:transposase InsO family protein
VAVTATFRLLSVFVVIAHANRRLLHVHVTASPTAAWRLQQLREAMPADHGSHFLLHDRESIFSPALDQRIRHLGLHVLKTPVRTPVAHAICERVLGTLRRACLDFVMLFTETHVRRLLQGWVCHDNVGRPHMALGPGMPQPLAALPAPLQEQPHRWPAHGRVVARPMLDGLLHEYRLEEHVA